MLEKMLCWRGSKWGAIIGKKDPGGLVCPSGHVEKLLYESKEPIKRTEPISTNLILANLFVLGRA